MASYETLRAALALLVNPALDGTADESPHLESLSSAGRARLTQQRISTRGWRIGRRRNVTGLGIAEKVKGAGSTGELSLTIYVKRKYSPNQLVPESRIPPELELEGLNDAVPTDVREIGIPRLESLTGMIRPVICGYSVGRIEKGWTGTLGCLVTTRDTKEIRLLSNSHILAKSGLGKKGDPVFQPSPDDTTTPNPAVGTLADWKDFDFGAGFVNHVDAAIAAPIDPQIFDPDIFDIGRPKGVHTAQRGMMVQKVGRTSEHTWGRVEDVDFHTSIQYPRPKGSGFGAVRFSNLILCSRYTEPGDSGSLVLDTDGYAVGLHFCGTPTTSIACGIQLVLDEMSVDIVV